MSKQDHRIQLANQANVWFNLDTGTMEDEEGNAIKTRYAFDHKQLDELMQAIDSVDKQYLEIINKRFKSVEESSILQIIMQKRIVLGALADVLTELKTIE